MWTSQRVVHVRRDRARAAESQNLHRQQEIRQDRDCHRGNIDIDDLARKLKTKCAAGGTAKDGKIELQGDHKKKVKETLEEMGFKTDVR
jgi:predicted translation initiation factor SUI1